MMMLVVKARCELALTLMLTRRCSSSPYALKNENFGICSHGSASSLIRFYLFIRITLKICLKPMDIPETRPSATSVLFARGVIARLAIWATLRIAVKENWGGPGASSKRTWLASVIVDAFEEQKPIPDDQYIEELLLQVMSDEFETVIEDGSAEAVAVDIVHLWDETQIGKGDLVVKFEELAEKVRGKMPNVQEQVVSEDEDEDED
jgi:pre-rRNA-processing protein TSR2